MAEGFEGLRRSLSAGASALGLGLAEEEEDEESDEEELPASWLLDEPSVVMEQLPWSSLHEPQQGGYGDGSNNQGAAPRPGSKPRTRRGGVLVDAPLFPVPEPAQERRVSDDAAAEIANLLRGPPLAGDKPVSPTNSHFARPPLSPGMRAVPQSPPAPGGDAARPPGAAVRRHSDANAQFRAAQTPAERQASFGARIQASTGDAARTQDASKPYRSGAPAPTTREPDAAKQQQLSKPDRIRARGCIPVGYFGGDASGPPSPAPAPRTASPAEAREEPRASATEELMHSAGSRFASPVQSPARGVPPPRRRRCCRCSSSRRRRADTRSRRGSSSLQ